MPRPNLLAIDDILLRAAQVAGVAWVFGGLLALGLAANDRITPGTAIATTLVCAAAPLTLFVTGLKLRRREKRAWVLHRLVDDHVEISAPDLLRDSDFTRATLDRAIRDLNNSGAAYLVWDRKAGVVQDGRLRSTRVEVDECGACGAKVAMTVTIGDVSTARCPYCHDPIGAERLTEEKARLIDALDTDPVVASARTRPAPDFSVPIFVVLLLFFWPLGVGYAIWKWRAGQIGI